MLHSIPAPVIEHDIAVFLNHELGRIRDKFNRLEEGQKLPLEWPGEASVQRLVSIAQALIISAATICRLVGDSALGNPRRLLDEVLSQKRNSASRLHVTYSPALKQQLFGL